MERKTITITVDKSLADTITRIAYAEKRSFTKQVETMLESALSRQKDMDAIGAGKTQIDPALLGGR